MEDVFDNNSAECAVCLDLNKDYLRRRWRSVEGLFASNAPYSSTINRVSESALAGCRGCVLVHTATERIKDEFKLGFRNVVLEFVDDENRAGLSITLNMVHPVHTLPGDWERAQQNPDVKIATHAGPSKDAPEREFEDLVSSPAYEIFLPSSGSECARSHPSWDSILCRPPRLGDTGGDGALEFTRSSIEQCRASHPRCNLDESDWGLPTRVLDLGTSTCPITSTVQLLVTQNQPEPYVCLSHCWGSHAGLRPLETTIETVQEFQEGIPFDKLPRTFQDAVVFTRKLGYRYLWIDSLCIVQDDNDDWLREAGRMASIYENAVLTLASASSPDSGGGLFRQSAPHTSLGDVVEEGTSPALRRFSNPAFFSYDHRRLVRERPGSDDTSPLLKRAWVYQERILSRRVLFFTPLELVFECRTSSTTEAGYSWVDTRPKHGFASAYNPATSSRELSRLWRESVRNFSALGLTLHKDTLPAMAGLATRLSGQFAKQGRTGDYVAGLWRETFLEDLLWETVSRVGGGPPRFVPGVPSWSWARSDLPKRYNTRKYLTSLCSVEDVVTSPLDGSDNTFAGVSSGYAILSGYLLPARQTRFGIVVDKNPRVHHRPRMDYEWTAEEGGPDGIRDGDELFILPLLTSQQTTLGLDVEALVLRQDRDSQDRNVFKRIGIFQPPISVQHLQGHHYIFERTDVCVQMYRALIEYGESLLGEDGLYGGVDETESEKPLWLASETELLYQQFQHQAWYLHLCRYGPEAEVPLGDFFGRMHLDALRLGSITERIRMEDWERRNVVGEGHIPKRTLIKLV
ncbi:HET domain protein [Aspergillus carlsbadensis]|nr:HET domain protein [Aspergillus carlsbadensis]